MQKTILGAISVCAAFAVAGFVAPAAQSGRRYIDPQMATPTGRPFSGGVLVGDTFYISGTLGLEAGQKVPASPEAEATNVLDSIQKTLSQAGMTMDDLVSVQVFCSNVAHYDAFNKIYRGYFKQEFPARAFIGSGPLLFGARFEIMGVAVKRR